MNNPKRYTITTALIYANGPIHIGHLAGVHVPADIYARYLRSLGKDVHFIGGSDEHGVPITIKAKKEGITPQKVVDKYHKMLKDAFIEFGISFDHYSRTTSKIHHKTASDFFKKLYENGKFLEETNQQLYDKQANQFLADRFVIGTCPKCGNDESYGDQCEKCGTSHNATDLINPKSAITGNKPSLKETKHWYLPLNEYENWLRSWIVEGHANDWKPNVLGQVKSWLDDGLRPRAVTRDLDWGIPVPVKGAEGKVLYVWFDAPIGYISASKEWAEQKQKQWQPYWKDKDTKLVHFIGKDNIVFHCIIFPAMLKAEGSFIVPENVPANEFLNLEDHKISTSKNWAVWLHEYLQDFPDKQDVLRYVLTANAPESKDNNFTWKDFQARNNNELVAIFGNFINRVVVLTNKYYDGIIPAPNQFSKVDLAVLNELKLAPKKIGKSIQRYRFREGLGLLMNVARLGNKYLADEEPWKQIKVDEERTKTIMYVALQISRVLSVLAEPFLPFTTKKLATILNVNLSGVENLKWNDILIKDELIEPGHKIEKATLLFAKIEDQEIEKQLAKLQATKTINKADNKIIEPIKEIITFEDFTKLDIRIGTILKADKIAKTKKLLQLQVDLGSEIRTIVSGIAESFTPEEVLGKKVSVLTNLAPRKIKGVESNGMILMTENHKGKLVFIAPDKTLNAVKNGEKVS